MGQALKFQKLILFLVTSLLYAFISRCKLSATGPELSLLTSCHALHLDGHEV